MFDDLDWPLNASRGLSATAEFLVFTFQYWMNLKLCWKFSSSVCVCVCVLCIDQTFGRKHSLVAHRHQNNLSIQSTDTQWPLEWPRQKASGSGRVGLGHGSKVQTRFHLLSWKYVAELYIRCTCIAEMAPHLPMQKSKIKKEIVASTYVMISRNVHIYVWLREAYVSAQVVVCVCTVSTA